jgi:hypothetical protein
MEASGSKFRALIKILIIFEDFHREIEAFSKTARLFKYIFKGKGDVRLFRNVSVAFIKPVAAGVFWQSAPD